MRDFYIVAIVCSLTASLPTKGRSTEDIQRWISIGPRPILGGDLEELGGLVSGRVRAVAVDPADANHWLIGAASGGVWDTHDAGDHWLPRTDDQATLYMGAITFAPSDPNIVYAGTGEEAVSEGAGMLKSTDGGVHWQLLAQDTFNHTACTVIQVDPLNPNTVLAGTTDGRTLRQDNDIGYAQFLTSAPPMGIQRSTNGGLTWSLTLMGQATDLAVHPGDFDRQYAGLGGYWGTITNGVLISTNGLYRSLDGGQTWTTVSGPWSLSTHVGRIQLGVAPSNPDVLFVSIAVAFHPFDFLLPTQGSSLGLWRTTNAWAATPTWTKLPDPGDVGYQLFYDHVLTVDPTNSEVLYFGAVPLKRFTGGTWETLGDVIHRDYQCMAWVGNRLVVGNDGGVYSTMDRGNTWNNHNADLAITQFYFGRVHPSSHRFAIAGSQDNAFEKWNGTNSWDVFGGADGVGGFLSPSQPDTHIVALIQLGAIFRTFDGAATYTEETTGLDLSQAAFLNPLAMHPNNEDLLLLGTDRVWKCTNFFSAITPVWYGNSPAQSGKPTSPGSVSAITFVPSDPTGRTYAYGNRYGELRLTTNGGATWQDLDSGNSVPDRYVTALAFDATDANVLYVTLSGLDEETPTQPGHLFKTANALSAAPSWTNISPPANRRHLCIALDTSTPDTLYVGTEPGVWKTTDDGDSWNQLGPETGLPNVPVFDLQFQPTSGRVFAFTYGRGAFALLTPPVLERPLLLVAGSAEVPVHVHLNESYTVEASTDLENWTEVSTFTATNTTMIVMDEATGSEPQRYYRAHLNFP